MATLTGFPRYRCNICKATVLDLTNHIHEAHVNEVTVNVPGARDITVTRDDKGYFQCPVCNFFEFNDGRLLQVSHLISLPLSTRPEPALRSTPCTVKSSPPAPQTSLRVRRGVTPNLNSSRLPNGLDLRMPLRLQRSLRTPSVSDLLLPMMKLSLILRRMRTISSWTTRLSRSTLMEKAIDSDPKPSFGL